MPEYRSILSNFVGDIAELHFLPPVPGQKLVTSCGFNKSILPYLNKAVLHKLPIKDGNAKKLFVPVQYGGKVVAVAVADHVGKFNPNNENWEVHISKITDLFVDKIILEKQQRIDPETGLLNIASFRHLLTEIVDSSLRVTKGEKSFLDSFAVGLIRIFPANHYPVDFWSSEWLSIKGFASFFAERIPDGLYGSFMPGGEIVFVLPGKFIGDGISWLGDFLHKISSDFPLAQKAGQSIQCALVNFPEDFSDYFNVVSSDAGLDRVEAWISRIFDRLWKVLNSTVTTIHKQIWYWDDLCCLGVAPDDPHVLAEDVKSNVTSLKSFSCLAMKLREEYLTIPPYMACETLLKVVEQVLPDNSLLSWVFNRVLAAIVPVSGKEEAMELAKEILSKVEEKLGKGLNIGISCYPSDDFPKEEIIQNALKALVHAGLASEHGFIEVDSVSFNISGDNFFNQGKLELARREYEKGIRIDDKNLNLLNSLGVCYGELGVLGKAESTFGRVLEIEPENFMANFNLGCLRLRQRKLDEAERMLSKAAEANPNNAETHFFLGKINFERKDFVTAIFHLEKAVGNRKDWKAARRLLGECYSLLGNRKKAMEHYKQVLRLNPEDTVSLNALGCLYGQDERNLEVAISLCEKAVAFDQKNEEYRLNLARMLYKAGDLRDSLRHVEIILSNNKNAAGALELKQEIETRLSKIDPGSVNLKGL